MRGVRKYGRFSSSSSRGSGVRACRSLAFGVSAIV